MNDSPDNGAQGADIETIRKQIAHLRREVAEARRRLGGDEAPPRSGLAEPKSWEAD